MCGVEINSVPVTPGCPVNVKDTFLMVKEDGSAFEKFTYEDMKLCFAGVTIPQVQRTITNNELFAYYNEESIDKSWLSMNPEVFLMRDKRRKKSHSKGAAGFKTIGQGVVHPADGTNSIGKWAGWKWFGGKQFGHQVTGGYGPGNVNTFNRKTEFTFSPTEANQPTLIPFVNEMFWGDQNGNDYFPVSSWGAYLGSGSLRPRGNMKGGSKTQKRRKTQKFYLVFAIDNPFATKTNGLCPKIFGNLSLPFYTTLEYSNGGNIRIILTAQPSHRKASRALMLS